MNALGFTESIVIIVAVFVILLPLWKICSKAGFNPWLSLLFFVPLVNILLLYYLAFAHWPIHHGQKNSAAKEVTP